MTMVRSSSRQQFRKLFPMAALAVGALMFAAVPVNVGLSGFGLQQAHAQGEGADHGGGDRGGAEGGGSDRGGDRGGADNGGADAGSADKGGADTGSAGLGASVDTAGHDATDR
jgi:hypothetical protein